MFVVSSTMRRQLTPTVPMSHFFTQTHSQSTHMLAVVKVKSRAHKVLRSFSFKGAVPLISSVNVTEHIIYSGKSYRDDN